MGRSGFSMALKNRNDAEGIRNRTRMKAENAEMVKIVCTKLEHLTGLGVNPLDAGEAFFLPVGESAVYETAGTRQSVVVKAEGTYCKAVIINW